MGIVKREVQTIGPCHKSERRYQRHLGRKERRSVTHPRPFAPLVGTRSADHPNERLCLIGQLSRWDGINAAVNKLRAFIGQVDGLWGGAIDEITADLLIRYAQNLIRVLGGDSQS